MVMGLPVAVTASLMLSTMLGLKFEAMTDGKWNHHFSIEQIKPSRPHMKPMEQTRPPTPIQNDPQNNNPTTPAANNPSTTESIVIEITNNSSSSNKPVEIGSLEIAPSVSSGVQCGPVKCKDGEICVSWVKVRNETSRRSRESPLMSHQCLEDDGKHYTKMDPLGIQLCENGQVPRIIKRDQSCLREDPPCPLVWMFECISEADAGSSGAKLHSCKVKKCPGACVEVINCELDPPCFTVAECTVGGRVTRISV